MHVASVTIIGSCARLLLTIVPHEHRCLHLAGAPLRSMANRDTDPAEVYCWCAEPPYFRLTLGGRNRPVSFTTDSKRHAYSKWLAHTQRGPQRDRHRYVTS